MLNFILGLAVGTLFGTVIGSANALAKATDMITGNEDRAANRSPSCRFPKHAEPPKIPH